MKRSAGVTASAVIVLIGSSAGLLVACVTVIATIVVSREGAAPPLVGHMMLFGVALEVGLALWGIASGIGLLRLREWARISVLVFSGLLLLICLPGVIFVFTMPFPLAPNVDDPELYRQMLLEMRVNLAVLYGLLISVAAFWLYFFNTRSVRDQFRGLGTSTNITCAPGIGAAEVPRQVRARPISISIIAWYLVVTGLLFPVSLATHGPVMFLWFVLRGPRASAVLISMGLLEVVIGIAMLKLRSWSRILAICYFGFLVLESLTMVLVPGADARYQRVAAEVQSKFELPAINTSAPVHFPLWIGLIFSLPLQGVILWFLVKNKPAFAPPRQQTAV